MVMSVRRSKKRNHQTRAIRFLGIQDCASAAAMKCSTCDETDAAKFRWRAERNRYESTCRACNAARMRRYHKRKIEAALTAEKELIEADPYRYTVGKVLERAGLDKDKDFINGE